MNANRDVTAEAISQENANKIGKDYLATLGIPNMKETYYLKQEGIVTINYASLQNDVVMYPDLIKGKVEDQEFLVYINAENGREEDILLITNTPNGTLTM